MINKKGNYSSIVASVWEIVQLFVFHIFLSEVGNIKCEEPASFFKARIYWKVPLNIELRIISLLTHFAGD